MLKNQKYFNILGLKLKIFLTGVSDIGKSSIGLELSRIMDYLFYDLDIEIETYFKMTIPKLKTNSLTEYGYRTQTAVVLKKIIEKNKNANYIVALPPSGLMDAFSL